MGTQVRIALGPRRVAGWVVEDDVEPVPGVTLRPISAVRGWGPPPAVLQVAAWAAWRWAGPVSTFLGTASSPLAVRSLPTERTAGSRPEPASGAPAAVTGLDGGTTVVRLGPGSDPWPVVFEAARRIRHGGDGASALVLAPGHSAADDVARRLRAEGVVTAVLPEQWARARSGGCVAVGTRAAAFAPVPRLAAAVVLDAHDEAYHEERAPTWAAPVVVAERARRDGAPCALVSPCPTLELLALGPLVVPTRTEERRGWPPVEVIDRRADDPRTGLFSARLVRLVRDVAALPGGRVVCVVNRTGRVRLLSCASCGELARCEHCGGPLELVGAPTRLAPEPGPGGRSRTSDAARCGRRRHRGRDTAPPLPPLRAGTPRRVRAVCGRTRLKALRLGVTRAREDLEALVGSPVGEVWGPAPADGTERARLRAASVVVGTEAALHRVRRADAVVFLEFDSELLAPRFRAAEEALALLARARASCPGPRPGPVTGPRVVSPSRPASPSTLHSSPPCRPIPACSPPRRPRCVGPWAFHPSGRWRWCRAPPPTPDGSAVRAAAPDTVSVTGPVDGSWSVRANDHGALCDLLGAVPRPPGRLRVEVDPVRA